MRSSGTSIAHSTEPPPALTGTCHDLQHSTGQDEVVRQQDRDGVLVVVEEVLDATDRMTETQRLLLDHRGDLEEVRGGLADLGEHGLLAALGEGALQHEVLDEVGDHPPVLARGGGDDQEPFGAGGLGLLGDQLDARGCRPPAATPWAPSWWRGRNRVPPSPAAGTTAVRGIGGVLGTASYSLKPSLDAV